MRRNLMFAIAIGLATVGSGGLAWSDDAGQAGRDLHRMADGVAIVEPTATSTVSLVGRHHLGLDLDAAPHELLVRKTDAFRTLVEDAGVGDEAVLGDLAPPRTQLAIGSSGYLASRRATQRST